MLSALRARRLPVVVAVAVVVFAFWPALFGGGSLVSADIVATVPPFDSHRPDNFTLENGPGDPINIHAHWASLAADIRAGGLGWWNDELAGGQPSLKGGVPVFNLPYLVVPEWYAPGLVAALRVLVAVGLAAGFLRTVGLGRIAALAGGVAFGFSGFMVGWMNWPHSSVAALAPGLLWAIERLIRDPVPWRAVPLGGVVALMVWANFPSVLIHVLLGAAVYGSIRLVDEWRRSTSSRGWVTARLSVVAGAAVIVALLAGPHLIGFGEYLDWADTSHRVDRPDDSSAGVGYLMTAVAPAIWGSDAVGVPWFGDGNWVEYNAHVGASIAVLAGLGAVSGLRSADRRRRSVVLALLVVASLGVLIAYVGGPVGVALGNLAGPRGGLMTRAKVLWSIGVSLGAAFGVERLVADGDDGELRRELLLTASLGLFATVLFAPSILDWLDTARRLGVLRETVAVSTAPFLAGVATIGLVVARVRRSISGPMVGWGLAVVVICELLSFAMPVPTIVSRDERLGVTPAHDAVAAELGPGERLAGEGGTFFPSTTQLFDIADARGQMLKSPGYQALLEAVDPDMLRRAGGGTSTYPNIAEGTDPTNAVWDAMAVGIWAQFPDSMPYGTVHRPPVAARGADPSVQPLAGRTVVPEGGLRAAVVEISPLVGGFVDVTVTTDDGAIERRTWVEPDDAGLFAVAVLGEHLVVGSDVRVSVSAPEATLLVGVDADGSAVVGAVAGDDDLELIRVGDVILLDRPVDPVRVEGSAIVLDDPVAAARAVSEGHTVIDRDVGLPSRPVAGRSFSVRRVERDKDRITVDVDADAAGLLVVSEAHYPGWTAKVDGVATGTVVADAAFIGVPIPTGAEVVELKFRPRHLDKSLLALIAAALLIAGLLGQARRRGDLRLRPRSSG